MILELATPEVQAQVRPRLRVLQMQKGRTVISVATQSESVFFVTEGELQALLYSPSGKEVSVRQIGTGELFGELAALDGQPRAATVVAITNARLIEMSRGDFMACLESSPRAALWLTRRLAAEVRRLTERMFELSALGVSSRLHCELLRLVMLAPDARLIEPAPTHVELANRIGTHREAVTREISRLAELNILQSERRKLIILDLPQLEHIVGRAVGGMLRDKTPTFDA